ncbi:MAG: glyoxalase/bleomycin resistance/extradiol dioxygenase family protein [Robiginitomaculum sp.]|nr:MAG: glyoxalase/bleomycin resistance/extradiol dioxygenase family protein [Robiginitomaculum sp.]
MAASIGFYQALGLKLIVESAPHYVRFEFPTPNTGEPDTLSLHEVTEDWTPSSTWPLIYFEVDDLDAYLLELKEHNITPLNPAKTEDWLWREADIFDPSGNTIRLYTAGEHRRFPPWRVD